MIKILLVDDHELLRAGLRSRLERENGIAVVGEADSAERAVVMARAVQPDVILLDEVSMGLAPKVVDEIFEALRRLADTGVALLLVEQYINRALDMADKVVLLDRGQVAFDGPPADLNQDTVLRRYLGTEPASSP